MMKPQKTSEAKIGQMAGTTAAQTPKALDLYNYESKFERWYARFEKSNIRLKDKEAIKRFLLRAKIDGYSYNRRFKYLCCLMRLSRLIKKPIASMSVRDLTNLQLQLSTIPIYSREGHLIILKRFLRFLGKKPLSDEIRTFDHKSPVTAEQILTKEEVSLLIENALSIKESVMYCVQYESGMRVGELLKLPRSRILFDDRGAKLIPDDKTGPRIVRIVESVPFLKQYIDKNQEEYPFLMHPTIYGKRFKEAAKRAGIKRRVWPYLFRHSRITNIYGKIPDQLLKRHCGWSDNTRMVSTYVHLSDKELDDSICGLYDKPKIHL